MIDAILEYCREYDAGVTYEDLFGRPPHQKAA
jgi:hypothetical protein